MKLEMLGHAGVLWSAALRSYQSPKDWDEVLSYNACVMMGLSKIPDEFFEEYEKLEGEERHALYEMLLNANLPTLYVSNLHSALTLFCNKLNMFDLLCICCVHQNPFVTKLMEWN